MTKKTLMIDKQKFIEWYFDNDTCQSFGSEIIDELIAEGKVTRTLQNTLETVGYIPVFIILNKDDLAKEDIGEDYDEVEEPTEKYKLKFKEIKCQK